MTTTTKTTVSQATAEFYRQTARASGDPAMAAAAERLIARANDPAADEAALLEQARAAMNAARKC